MDNAPARPDALTENYQRDGGKWGFQRHGRRSSEPYVYSVDTLRTVWPA